MVYIAFLVGTSVFIVSWLLLQAGFRRKLAVADRVKELSQPSLTAVVGVAATDNVGQSDQDKHGARDAKGKHRSNKLAGRLKRDNSRGQRDGKKANREGRMGQGIKATAKSVSRLKALRGNATTKRTSFMGNLEVWLRRADIKLPAKDFLVRWVATVGALTVLSFLSPLARVGVLLIPLAFVGTAMYLRMRMQRRLHQFNDGLYDMLILVANALRAGHSFVQAMHLIVEESVGPMKEEFSREEAEMQVGVLLEDALTRMAERVASEDFDLIVTAIAIQRQIGGNLAEVLLKIADTIGERVKLKREIKALTSQGRLSAAIFMGLPAGVAILLYIMNPSYMSVLFQTTIGLAIVVVAIVSQTVGFLIIRKIVNVQL